MKHVTRRSNNKGSLLFLLALMALPNAAFSADEIEDLTNKTTFNSYSTGKSISELNSTTQQQIVTTLKQNVLLGNSDPLQKKAIGLSRDQIIHAKMQAAQYQPSQRALANIDTVNSAENPIEMQAMFSNNDAHFVVYDGYSTLIEDNDADGFYQTFSVTFDADLVSYDPYHEALIYAELYLSENGGPWQHYYTTDNFVIMGESTDDKFEVYSTLAGGFNPNHYDVLIDIYEVNSPFIMASYSSENSNSLYALPLESHHHDEPYGEYSEDIYIHGGSYSLSLLLLLLLTLLIRQFSLNKIHLTHRLNRLFSLD